MSMENNSDRTRVGMAFFLAAEVMFFAGLLAAYIVLRSHVTPWPPPDQPRFPWQITGFNTLILLSSGVTILWMEKALKKGCHLCVLGWLGLTAIAGILFLGIQGYEWWQLLQFGLTTAHNIYAGLFYVVVGVHAIHLIVALGVMGFVFFQVIRGNYRTLVPFRMYWAFVVLIWPVIYGLVYF